MNKNAVEKVKAAAKKETTIDPKLVSVLVALAAKVGAPDPEELASLLEGTVDENLIAEGRRIATRRIVEDASRFYSPAWDYISKATPEQLEDLAGLTPALVVVAIHQAVELQKLHDQQRLHASSDATARKVMDGAADRSFSAGRKQRDQLHGALRVAAGQVKELNDELTASVGTADTAQSLADGIDGLVALGRRWLAATDNPGLVRRMKLAGVSEKYLARIAAGAASLRAANDAALLRPGQARVTQAQLDRADGINLLLMGHVFRGFQNGHDLNPAVPRFTPIGTKTYFGRKTKKAPKVKTAKAPTAVTPATPEKSAAPVAPAAAAPAPVEAAPGTAATPAATAAPAQAAAGEVEKAA